MRNHSAVVICSPVGFEQVRSHETIRALSEVLANDGHTVLRFDYPSTGDSLDLPNSSGHVAAWIESIIEATRYAASLADSKSTSLIGIRLGGTLANTVAQEIEIDRLVLWEPSESGQHFCREMQILASATNSKAPNHSNNKNIDSGGFVITQETQESLKKLVLGKKTLLGHPPILLLERDDIRPNERRTSALEKDGSTVTRHEFSGYKQMMLAPQDSIAPVATISVIKEWLANQVGMTRSDDREPGYEAETSTIPEPITHFSNGLSEQAIQFGPEGRLFGILTRGQKENRQNLPTLIVLAGGAVPHYSANRMYVPLARRLATRGIDVLRVDLSGIGDSQASPDGPRQVPYTITMREDIESAMAAIGDISGAKSFSLLGLCSGAFGAMQAALISDQVTDIILVNQLVYFVPPEAYGKLAAGKIKAATAIDFPRNRTSPDRVLRKTLKSIGALGWWIGHLLQGRLIGGPLNRILWTLNQRNIQMVFIHSEDDPAIDALLLPAQQTVRRLIRSTRACRIIIPETDHTFSSAVSQQQLFDAVEHALVRRDNS
jgi:pimeloyl-ACP methyl ester carboxylesterase